MNIAEAIPFTKGVALFQYKIILTLTKKGLTLYLHLITILIYLIKQVGIINNISYRTDGGNHSLMLQTQFYVTGMTTRVGDFPTSVLCSC